MENVRELDITAVIACSRADCLYRRMCFCAAGAVLVGEDGKCETYRKQKEKGAIEDQTEQNLFND